MRNWGCYEFQYGGCKGNQNNFLTKALCQNSCEKGPQILKQGESSMKRKWPKRKPKPKPKTTRRTTPIRTTTTKYPDRYSEEYIKVEPLEFQTEYPTEDIYP